MKIDWASSFRSDGSRRRPPPSTMHGWLAKMRGTLLGDEKLRNKGMKEMRDARAVRRNNRERKRQRQSRRGLFSFFSTRSKPSRATSRGAGRGGHRGQRPNRLISRSSQTQKPSGTPRGSRKPAVTPRANQPRPQYSTARRGGRR